MEFTWLNTILAVLTTLILRKLVCKSIIEMKALDEWCDAQDELIEWIQLGISPDHPKTKRLVRKEEETRKNLEKIRGFKIND